MSTHEYRKSEIWVMIRELIESVLKISVRIPDDEILNLKERIRESLSLLPEHIEYGLKEGRNAKRSKHFRLARLNLVQCREYLRIAQRMNYTDNKEIIDQIELFANLIRKEYNLIKVDA